MQHGARFGILLGLREHKGGKFFARKVAMAVEKRAVEIFVEGSITGVKGGKCQVVAVLKILPIQIEGRRGFAAGVAVPAIGEHYSANIPKQRGDFRQRDGPRFFPARCDAAPFLTYEIVKTGAGVCQGNEVDAAYSRNRFARIASGWRARERPR